MNVKTLRKIVLAKKEVEQKLGIKVDNQTAKEVLALCIRKCQCACKGEEYLPLMYLFELPMQLEAKKINERTLEILRERRNEKCVVNV